MKIIKSLDITKSDYEIENGGTHIVSYCSWERLKPFIEQAVNKKPNEEIVGIIAEQEGIKIIFK